jgi:hypothetical protein
MGIGLNETPSGASVPADLSTDLADVVLAAKTTPHFLASPSFWIRATTEDQASLWVAALQLLSRSEKAAALLVLKHHQNRTLVVPMVSEASKQAKPRRTDFDSIIAFNGVAAMGVTFSPEGVVTKIRRLASSGGCAGTFETVFGRA